MERESKREKLGKGILIFFLALALLPTINSKVTAAEGGTKEKPWERFSLNLGGFITTLNSDVLIESSGGRGTDINVEDTLGLDSDMTVFRAEAILRLGESRRHRLDFEYFDLRRSGTKTISRNIEIGDSVFPIGTTIDTTFDLRIFKGAYSYSLFQNERFDFGAGIGLYVAPIDFKITSTRSGVFEEESVTAPLPVVKLHFDVAITPKFFLKTSADFFYLDYNNYQGRILDARIGLEYNIWKHLGLGLAYNYFYLKVDSDGDMIDWKGSVDFSFSGVMLYGKVMF